MDMYGCTAGFARLDVTPPLGTEIGGYFTPRYMKGLLDPLYVRAIAFGQGEKNAVLLSLDNCSMPGKAGTEWPGRIAEKLGLAPDAVFLTCTHSHTTPIIERQNSDKQYDAWLFRRLCDAARMALDDRREVTGVLAAQGEAKGLAFVRRYYMKDGTVMTNPPRSKPEDIVGPACDTDESMRVIRIQRADAPELILVNFQSHPDNIGGELISADFPGVICREMEKRVSGANCVFINGAEGQMVRASRMQPPASKGYQAAVEYGMKLSAVAAELYGKAVSTGRAGLSCAHTTVHAPTKRDPARVPESKRIVELFRADRKAEIHPSLKFANYYYAEANKIVQLEEEKLDYIDLPMTGLAFCGVALIGIPGEPFNEVGKHLRANPAFPVTCVCCLTNGAFGYYPTAEAYDQGGYESYNTNLRKGAAELLMAGGDELLAML